MKPPISGCTAFRALPVLAKVNALALCAAILALSALLWPVWLHEPNMAHGLFLPFLAAILIYESRRDANPRFTGTGVAPALACAALVVLSLASLAIAVVYAAALGWNHSVAEFMLATALALALCAAWLGFSDQRIRFIPVNWPAAVAVGLWIFAAEPPPGTYARLALLLQERVTVGVTHFLGAVGIAAYRVGNVIELAHTSVGVSEACSGIRSLISCTVAGLVLSALLVRRSGSRALLVVLSPVIGLAMNFVRSLILTLLANSGVQIEGTWHDLTGASILVVTTLLVAVLGLWLHRREAAAGVRATGPGPQTSAGHSRLQPILCAGLLAAAAAGVLIALASRAQPSGVSPGPDLAAILPEPSAGWTAENPQVDQFGDVLHTHALVERIYTRGEGAAAQHITLYMAYWRPGEAAVSLVDAHTPDACWPGTGWEAKPVPGERAQLVIGGRTLPAAECRMFQRGDFSTLVWFWHLHGGRPITYVDPRSALRLLGLAWHYGFSPPKDQLFVRVSSDRPWSEIASQPILRQFFVNVQACGL